MKMSEAEGHEVSWNEIGRRAGFKSGYVSKVRYGERDPGPDSALKLANALLCDVTWLLWGHGRMYPPRQLAHQGKKSDEEPDPPSRSGVRETPTP